MGNSLREDQTHMLSDPKGDAAAIRRTAEARLQQSSRSRSPRSEAELLHWQRELELREIELAIRADQIQSQVEWNETLLETMVDGYILADLEGVILRVNPSYCETTGRTPAELVGMNIRECEIELSAEEVTRRIAEFQRCGRMRFETRHRHRNGSEVDLLVSVTMVSRGGNSAVAAFLRDITKEKSAERSLTASERRFRAFFDAEPECVKVVSASGQLVDMNPAGFAMLQVASLDEACSRPLMEWIEPQYRAGFADLHRRVMTGESGEFQFEITGVRGRKLWLETYAAPQRNSQGQIIGLLGVTRDVTARKTAETSLRKFETIFQNAGWGMVIADPQTHVMTHVNPAFAAMHGYTVAELTGTNLARTFAPEAMGDLARHVEAVHEKGHHIYELLHRRKDGSRFPCMADVTAFKDETGRVLFRAATFEDISARRHAEQALTESEARYRALFEYAPYGIVIVDREGRLLDANPGLCRMLGYTRDEIVGRDAADFVTPDVRADVEPALQRIREAGDYLQEWQVRRKDGSEFSAEIMITEMSDRNLVGMIRDITERKRADESIRQQQLVLRRVLDTNRNTIFVKDRDSRIVLANQAMADFYGLTVDEVTGQCQSEIHAQYGADPDDIAAWLADDRQVIDFGEPLDREETGTDRNGVTHFYHTMKYRLMIAADRPTVLTITEDITERKLAEEALRESESRLRLALDAAKMGTFEWDISCNRLVWSRWHETLWGFSAGEFRGTYEEFAARVHPDDLPDLETEVQRCMTTHSAFVSEFRVVWPDGTLHWISATGEFTFDVEQQPIQMRGAVLETTARKQAETERAQVFERITDAFVALNKDWCYTYVNEKAGQILGRRAEELIGKHIWTEFPEGIGQNFHHAYQSAMAEQKPVFLEEHFVPFDRWFESRIYPGPEGLSIYFHDITERKQWETALRKSEDRLRLSVAAGNIGLWDWDLQTNDVYFSAEWKGQLGFRDDEINSDYEAWESRLHPDDKAETLARMNAFLAGTESEQTSEFRLRHKDGSYRWIVSHGAMIRDQDGRPIRILGSHLDRTEQRSVEESLRQSQKMEAIGQFAGGIAHDFNNLLTIIDGYTKLLLANHPPDSPGKDFLNEIHHASQRAVDLTQRLLTFGRRQMRFPETLDLNEVVDETVRLLERLIGDDIVLEVSLDAESGWVSADRGQISQVLLNLASNGRDAMPDGGRLRVQTRIVRGTQIDSGTRIVPDSEITGVPDSVGDSGTFVLLSVTDSGCGMTRDVQQKIFDPFFTTKPVGKGTGLGLATVHGIVLHSGGHLRVESEVGKGTAFHVYLPQTPAAVSSPKPASDSPVAARGTETILLVEDDDALRRMVRTILQESGYTVLEAADGTDAQRVYSDHPQSIDLLLTDVVIPGLNGPQLAEQLVRLQPGIRVLFTSAFIADSQTRQRFMRDVCFLSKPFSPRELVNKVREILDA